MGNRLAYVDSVSFVTPGGSATTGRGQYVVRIQPLPDTVGLASGEPPTLRHDEPYPEPIYWESATADHAELWRPGGVYLPGEGSWLWLDPSLLAGVKGGMRVPDGGWSRAEEVSYAVKRWVRRYLHGVAKRQEYRGRKGGAAGPVPRGGSVTLDFLRVGQGDSTVITLLDGVTKWLVDAHRDSSSRRSTATAVSDVFDQAFVSHPHFDHVSGLPELIAANRIRNLTVSANLYGELGTYSVLTAAAEAERASALTVSLFSRRLAEQNLQFRVIAEPRAHVNRNNMTAVMVGEFGDTAIVLAGDLPEATSPGVRLTGEVEVELTKLSKDCLVYKAAHHGSHSSPHHRIVTAHQGSGLTISVIPCGLDGATRYGHPNSAAVESLARQGSVHRTDICGDVRVVIPDVGQPTVTLLERRCPTPFAQARWCDQPGALPSMTCTHMKGACVGGCFATAGCDRTLPCNVTQHQTRGLPPHP